MSRLHLILTVATWEFRRFYRLRDQLLSLVLSVLGSAFGFGVQYFVSQASGPVRVAVLHAQRLPPLELPQGSKIVLENVEPDQEAARREAVGRRTLDGLLVLHGTSGAELLVARDPVWLYELQAALNDARGKVLLREAHVDPRQLAQALSPLPLEVNFHAVAQKRASRAEKWAAGAFVGLTCLGVFLGMASFFAGITGEKQLRVTEQVVSAISPQTWVDGKLLGLTAAAFGTLLTYGSALALTVVLIRVGGVSFDLPLDAIRPANLLLYLLFALLGIFFWNCVFAAIAVTINDPNSSTRSSLMFLPMLFVALGFPGLQTPDAPVMRALAVLPGTSSTVMTVRLVLSEVAAWEVATALLLLVLAILIFRRVAGTIFTVGILMTGKELSWREAWTALSQSSETGPSPSP